MADIKERVNDMLQELKQKRDELQVQVHLAKLEVNDEWQDIEKKIHKLELKSKELAKATAGSASDVGTAAQLLGLEIRNGFKNIAKHF